MARICKAIRGVCAVEETEVGGQEGEGGGVRGIVILGKQACHSRVFGVGTGTRMRVTHQDEEGDEGEWKGEVEEHFESPLSAMPTTKQALRKRKVGMNTCTLNIY